MKDSVNDMVLHPLMMEALYGRVLVETDPPRSKSMKSLRYLGNNARRITVLVDGAGFAFLPEDQLGFLTKMLAACKLNTGDTAIVNKANGLTMDDVFDQLKPEKMIAFGTTVSPDLPLFTIGTFNNINLLQAPGLDELSADSDEAKSLKIKLWNCLKTLFDV